MSIIRARDLLMSFEICNKNAICEIIPINDKKILVKWIYLNLTYQLFADTLQVLTYSIKIQRAMHQAKLIMKIRTNLRRFKSKHYEFKYRIKIN